MFLWPDKVPCPKRSTSGEQMWELTHGAVQQRAQELHFGRQLGQAEVHGLVVQDRLPKHLPLPGVLNSLLYNSLHWYQGWKKQSTEWDIILSDLFSFLLKKKFFSHCTTNILGFLKQIVLYTQFGVKLQFWEEFGTPLYLEDIYLTRAPNCQNLEEREGKWVGKRESHRKQYRNYEINFMLSVSSGALAKACGNCYFWCYLCPEGLLKSWEKKSEGRQCSMLGEERCRNVNWRKPSGRRQKLTLRSRNTNRLLITSAFCDQIPA